MALDPIFVVPLAACKQAAWDFSGWMLLLGMAIGAAAAVLGSAAAKAWR